MEIQEKQLVMVRLNEDNNSFRAWLRVKFIDLDDTFLGEIELVDKDYTIHKIGEFIKLHTEDVIEIFSPNDGKNWCYSDNITRCDCPGLCRNK